MLCLLGLDDSAYWLSWGISHWSTLLASGLLCTVMCIYPFPHSSAWILTLFFALLAASLVSFRCVQSFRRPICPSLMMPPNLPNFFTPCSYFLSILFTTSKVAGNVTPLVYALAVLPGFIVPTLAPYGGNVWWWACLMPPSAASIFAGALVNWELISAGVNSHTFTLPVRYVAAVADPHNIYIQSLSVVFSVA